MSKIAVLGTGYVGLTMGVGLASFGFEVLCLDVDYKKIAVLQKGEVPFYEPGMAAVLQEQLTHKRIRFSTQLADGIKWADTIMITVGTPTNQEGNVDLSALLSAAQLIGEHLNDYKIIITKSTVPVGTNEEIKRIIVDCGNRPGTFDVVANPEFLREGNALHDFYHPSRVVIGVDNSRPIQKLYELYEPMRNNGVPFVSTDFRTAELVKYASNSFLAMKVAFINEIARFCDVTGADVETLTYAMGLDDRIGNKYLVPGPGFGGSCLPKDAKALTSIASESGIRLTLIEAAIESNEKQKRYIVEKINKYFPDLSGVRIAVLGVAFKAETDDIRGSASIPIVNQLLQSGAHIKLFDPQALSYAKELWKERVSYGDDLYETVSEVNALVILTEWNDFKEMDLQKVKELMKGTLFFDFRNMFDRQNVEDQGFTYVGLGRKNMSGKYIKK